eukprot:Nk52_evm43s554 gene=Nk52_evmTU43s554
MMGVLTRSYFGGITIKDMSRTFLLSSNIVHKSKAVLSAPTVFGIARSSSYHGPVHTKDREMDRKESDSQGTGWVMPGGDPSKQVLIGPSLDKSFMRITHEELQDMLEGRPIIENGVWKPFYKGLIDKIMGPYHVFVEFAHKEDREDVLEDGMIFLKNGQPVLVGTPERNSVYQKKFGNNRARLMNEGQLRDIQSRTILLFGAPYKIFKSDVEEFFNKNVGVEHVSPQMNFDPKTKRYLNTGTCAVLLKSKDDVPLACKTSGKIKDRYIVVRHIPPRGFKAFAPKSK